MGNEVQNHEKQSKTCGIGLSLKLIKKKKLATMAVPSKLQLYDLHKRRQSFNCTVLSPFLTS